MSELALPNSNGLALSGLSSASTFGDKDDNRSDFVQSGGAWHPRLKFMTGQSELVKRKKFPADHYAMQKKKDEFIDLGESFQAAVLGYRYKAVDFREKGKVKSYFDPKSKEFLELMNLAKVKPPQGQLPVVCVGVEFLLYVEGHGWAALHCTTFTLKGVAEKLFGAVQKYVVTFAHKLYEIGTFVYEGPDVMAFAGSIELPEVPVMNKIIEDFKNTGRMMTSGEDMDAPDTTGADTTMDSGRPR